MSKEIPEENKDDEILRVGRKRFEIISTAENHIRDAALEDIKFAYNVEDGQWPASLRQERKDDNRPCLTANKLRKFIAQVANKERDMRMAGKVVPVDDKGDVPTAKIYEDLIRQIEFQSRADEIYTHGGEQAIAGGFGYWRVLVNEMDDGFDQEITLGKIENQFSVYYDPRGNYCFIREGIPRLEYEEQYPDSAAVSFDYTTLGEEYALWYEEDKIFVAEYFWKEPVEKEIVQVLSPETRETKIFELKDDVTVELLKSKGWQVLKQRKVKTHRVMWAKITGNEVLETGEWMGKHIPVIEVLGDEVNIAGKKYKRSLIRDGKDPQRMYNYWLTSMTETVAMAPNAPYVISAKQIEGHEPMWNESNIKKRPYLLYNDRGKGIIPKREQPPTAPSGAGVMLNISNNDIQDTIGMFEASFGQKSNERSGRAVIARQQRSDLGTFHFTDNHRRAIIHTVTILIDLIPKVYDTERVVRVRGEQEVDGDLERLVTLNETVRNEAGNDVILNDISVGKYDVREDVRSYSTRRQETADFMLQSLQYAPTVAPLILDLLFKYQDIPGASEIEARIKKHLPAILQGVTGNKTETPPVDETGQT